MSITAAEYKKMQERMKVKPDSRSKKAIVSIGGKSFFARSSWEANIGAYLQFLRDAGEIDDWAHEPEEFWFEKVKRGTRSYLPDFKVWKNDGSFYFIEVKGYMDARSKTKLNRMKKYYPHIEVQLIDSKRYREIKKGSKSIKAWGLL